MIKDRKACFLYDFISILDKTNIFFFKPLRSQLTSKVFLLHTFEIRTLYLARSFLLRYQILEYTFPTANATALPIYVLMLLTGSRCYPKPRPGLGQGLPLSAVLIQSQGHTTTPRSSPLSLRLGTWNGWVGKDKKPAKSLCGDRVPTG